jgi:hypothetical protein
MAVIPIRDNRAYVGIGKQTSQGVAVAPVYFPRWLDGSSIQIDTKLEDVWEGDGSRHLNLIVKNDQRVTIKLVCNPRPNEVGLLEAIAQGSGADTFTAPTVNTTLAAPATAGATTISLSANTGLTGSGTAALALNPGGTDEEEVTITTPVSGTGPYTATLANGATLKNTHASAETVKGAGQHVLTDQVDGAYYTFEVSLADTAGNILRVRDCKAEQLKRSGKAGGLLVYELDVVGLATTAQTTPATVTLDTHLPFLYTQGVWTLDGSLTGDALAVEQFDITQKNNLDTVQTEQLNPAASIFGQLNADTTLDLLYQNGSRVAEVYFGGSAGTTDSQTVYLGSLTLLFTQPDGFHTVQYTIPTQAYTKVGMPQPKTDGKAMRQQVQATSISNNGVNASLVQTTVTNTTYAAY